MQFQTYFHLGMPKTASTYLQNEIFPYLTGIEFHKKRRFKEYKSLDPLNLESNHLFSMEFDRGLKKNIDEVVEYFPDAKIILCFRSQDSWIKSRYKYYIRKLSGLKFKEFFNFKNTGVWKVEELKYRTKIDYVLSKVNKTPLFLDFELLKSNPDRFIQLIENYTDTKLMPTADKEKVVKKSFSKKQLITIRRFNRLYSYRKLKSNYNLLNKIDQKYRESIVHTIAHVTSYLPDHWFEETLIKKESEKMREIRSYYSKDWEYVQKMCSY